MNRLQTLIDYGFENDIISDMATGYAEPGYSEPESGIILFANWNDRTTYNRETRERAVVDSAPSRLAAALEKCGAAIEWSDEWMTCECGKAFRCSPDSYCWRMAGKVYDGWVQCCECIESDPSDIIEESIGNPRTALTVDIDLEENGFACINTDEKGFVEPFENGLYGGQCDDPHMVAKSLEKLGIDEYLFTIDDTGQFDLRFSVWVRLSELGLADDAEWDKVYAKTGPIFAAITSKGADPAEAMKAALQDASAKMAKLPNDGIVYAQCRADGTADVRTVSPEEFLGGIK